MGFSDSGLSSQDRPQGIPPGPSWVPEAHGFASAPKFRPFICSHSAQVESPPREVKNGW